MRRLLVGLLTVLAVSACSADDPAQPRAQGSAGIPTPTGSPEAPAQDLVDQLLAEDVQPTPLKTVTGTITVDRASSPVTVDVLEVRAGETSTLLRWRLRSSGTDRVKTFGSSMSRAGLQDTRRLRVQSTDVVLQPYTYAAEQGGAFDAAKDLFCACSKLPIEVGPDGVLMYAVLPPLPGTPATVDVLLPGIAPATAVTVSR